MELELYLLSSFEYFHLNTVIGENSSDVRILGVSVLTKATITYCMYRERTFGI